MNKKFIVAARAVPDDRVLVVEGRAGWALLELHCAGPLGCTLRQDYGFAIETLHEAPKGAFPSHYPRYILHSLVEIVSEETEVTGTGMSRTECHSVGIGRRWAKSRPRSTKSPAKNFQCLSPLS